MKAQRRIIKLGEQDVVFDEKCACGNPSIEIDKKKPEYATCLSCLRVYRLMIREIDNGQVSMWGIYFDQYLMKTKAGQFISLFCEMPEDRYPRF